MTSILSSLEATSVASPFTQTSAASSSFRPFSKTSATQSSSPNTLTSSQPASSSTNDARTSSTTFTTSTVVPATSTSSAPKATTSTSSSKSSAGTTAAIAVPVVLGTLTLIGVVLFFCWRRRRRRRKTKDGDSGREPMMPTPIKRMSPLKPLRLSLPLATPMTSRSGTRSLWGNDSKSGESLPISQPQESRSLIRETDGVISKPIPIVPLSDSIRNELKLDEVTPEESVSEKSDLNWPIVCETNVMPDEPIVVLDKGPGVLPETNAASHRPVSETTTIATSSEVQTPKRPPDATHRPISTATSTATSFEEDWEFQMDDDVPPIPAIPNTQLIRKLSAKRSYEKATRLDLVARDDAYLSRRLNPVLVTPMYDNGNVVLPEKPSSRSLGRPQIKPLKSTTLHRSPYGDLAVSGVHAAGILFNDSARTTPSPKSPPTPFDIPLRHSSLAKAYMDPRKLSFLMESSSEDSNSDRAIRLRPKPLDFDKYCYGAGTSIQDLAYPVVPHSASEPGKAVKRPNFSFQLPIKLKSVSEASTVNEEEQSPLLPTIEDSSGTVVGCLKAVDPNNRLIISGMSPSTDIHASHAGRLVCTPSDFAPSEEVVTPQRTQSSDFIDSQFVMVNLQDERQ